MNALALILTCLMAVSIYVPYLLDNEHKHNDPQ